MCGIVAIFSRAEPVDESALTRATRALYHRGPDGQRHWISDDRRVGFGHARLSIIDLTTGDQPIASEDEQTRIIVNGEFYGYEAIQRELEGRGHRLRTRSDSEIALHLFEDYGVQCLHRLRGEFAIILWDARRRMIFAARDRFGIKPLFYAWHGSTLYFASEAKALFAAGVPARWDEEAVLQSIAGGGHQVRTLFDGVHQIPPGHYMLATDRHVQVSQYWDFNYPLKTAMVTTRPDAEYAEEFRHVLEEAVRIRLRADVPVGVYLSGGLDSCSALGLAARHHPDPIKAFTLTFDDADYDEEAIATEMAAKVGAEFHPIPIKQRDLGDNFADAVAQCETMCANAHGVAKYLLSKAVRDAGYKVVITGEGSDEILAGYPHFRRDMLLYNREGQDPETIRQMLDWLDQQNTVSRGLLLPDGDAGDVERVKRILGYVPSWIEAFSTRNVKMRPLLSSYMNDRHATADGFWPILDDLDVHGRIASRDPLHQSLYLWSKTVLCGYILTLLGDRMEMAHSIEGRVPFLDHHVVELTAAQPVSQKIRGMTEKFVLREAVRDVITDTVYRRQKHPFLSPPATLSPKDTFHAYIQDTLRGSTLASMPFFDQRAVIDLLDRLPAMDSGSRVANDGVLMLIMSLCALQERYAPSAAAAAVA
ncbi:MAG TPA: asparagine synthase (glutamine-hydrolyzing) [Vicinamibacterales bacterium]|jgi:asparagine synthase (glutamine-hydrolysing)|nr:asparagine synthase (glutamine-hydrolyzing) [Vicinamibacterales bacterium]